MINLGHLIFWKVILFSIMKSGITPVLSIHDYWREMDPDYDLSYLEPGEETSAETTIGCAMLSLRRNVTAFGYLESRQRCHFYNVDYYVQHIWAPVPGLQFFLRNEEIASDCFGEGCRYCMPIVETQMTWAEADTACRNLNTRLLEMRVEWFHRCVVMRLQYLRKSTANIYWLGGEYNPITNVWTWNRYGHTMGTPDYLWASGEPDNPMTESCVLLVPGGNYTVRSAECSEKHYALCVE